MQTFTQYRQRLIEGTEPDTKPVTGPRFITIQELKTAALRSLRQWYRQYSEPDTDPDIYERAKEELVRFVKFGVEGGRCEHLRPENGTVLYRGTSVPNEWAQRNRDVVVSFSTQRSVGVNYATEYDDAGQLTHVIVTPDLPCIQCSKLDPDAADGEVLIYFSDAHSHWQVAP